MRYRSTLFQQPGFEAYNIEAPKEGYTEGAGFVGLAAVKATEHATNTEE